MTKRNGSIWSAGTAIPETALVVTTMMMLLIGSLRIAAVGYTQMAADAAAFTAARLTATGDANAITKTHNAINRINPGDIYTNLALPPTTTAPVNYNVTDPSVRHGGFTIEEPVQLVVSVFKNDLDGLLIGSSATLPVQAFSVAAEYRDYYTHDDVNGDPLNGLGAFNDSVNYFSEGANTPPYFTGFHYISNCEMPLNSGPWDTCPGTVDFRALGMAEYLDTDNWDRDDAGIAGGNAIFQEMLCHQDHYANIAALVYANGTVATAQPVLTMSQSDIATVYGWDLIVSGGYAPSNYNQVGDAPLSPDAGC